LADELANPQLTPEPSSEHPKHTMEYTPEHTDDHSDFIEIPEFELGEPSKTADLSEHNTADQDVNFTVEVEN